MTLATLPRLAALLRARPARKSGIGGLSDHLLRDIGIEPGCIAPNRSISRRRRADFKGE